MNKKEVNSIINESIQFIRDVDNDKPNGEHFDVFHNENRNLIKKLKRLKIHIKYNPKLKII